METQERAPSPPSSVDLFVAEFAGDPPADDPPEDDPLVYDPPLDDPPAEDPQPGNVETLERQPLDNVDTVSSGSATLHDDLFDEIVRQVEYYFSDENLPNDVFLLKHVRKGKKGYVPIKLISSFKKMKKLTKDPSLIEAALRTSSLLVVSSDGKRVKRLHPLRVAEPEVRDEKSRTVLVENLPEDYSEDSIRRIFGTAGHIVGVKIHNPHSAEQLSTLKKADFAISSKLHALVEYDTVEAAKNAVLTLNDEMNWRNGLQVQVLLKRMEKYGIVQKRRKDVLLEKNNGAEALIPVLNHNDGLDKEDEENSNGSRGGRRNRYKGRGRGHGNVVPSGSNADRIISKPVSGPKMPDGTRGFTMGRGRPITTRSQSS